MLYIVEGHVLTIYAEVLEGAADVKFGEKVEGRDLKWKVREFLNGLFGFFFEFSKYNIVPGL